MAEKKVLVVSPDGQKVWTDPQVGTHEKYLEDGFRDATPEELAEAAAMVGKTVEELEAEMNPPDEVTE